MTTLVKNIGVSKVGPSANKVKIQYRGSVALVGCCLALIPGVDASMKRWETIAVLPINLV
jgi:hypothetical protein